jgi:stage II sporulation SpoE-like protein/GAF domain-containing protein
VTANVRPPIERRSTLRTERDRLALLAEMTRVLMSTLDVDEAIDRLTRLVVPRLGDWALVVLVDVRGRLRHAVGRHRDPGLAEAMQRFTDLSVEIIDPSTTTWQVAATGAPVLRPQVDPRTVTEGFPSEDVRALLERLGLATLMIVPLTARGRVVGVMVLAGGEARAPFTEADLSTATELGLRAGLAVDNAQVYARQRNAAEVMQRSLLSALPQPDGLQIAARYQPAAEEAAVGGDWYDAFVQPDGALLLSIGDVMGHDVTAAAAMGHLRTLLRAIAYDRQAAPAELLGRVDAALHGLDVETLATAVVVRIRAHDGPGNRREVTWSNAGHPPPLVLRESGLAETLDGSDLLLGLDPAAPRHEQTVLLAPGDTLLLYTDGLVERREDPSLETGLTRLRLGLAPQARAPLESLCDAALSTVVPGLADDIALIALRAGA